MKTIRLEPKDGSKSFYGKAHVISFDDGWKYLKSYDTIMVGVGPTNRIVKFSGVKTKTTSRHLDSFFKWFANSALNHKSFYKLATESNNVHPEIEVEQ